MHAMYSTLKHRNHTTEKAITFFPKERSNDHVTVSVKALETLYHEAFNQQLANIIAIPVFGSIKILDGNSSRYVVFTFDEDNVTIDNNRTPPMTLSTRYVFGIAKGLVETCEKD